jgi:hypothetical protein
MSSRPPHRGDKIAAVQRFIFIRIITRLEVVVVVVEDEVQVFVIVLLRRWSWRRSVAPEAMLRSPQSDGCGMTPWLVYRLAAWSRVVLDLTKCACSSTGASGSGGKSSGPCSGVLQP